MSRNELNYLDLIKTTGMKFNSAVYFFAAMSGNAIKDLQLMFFCLLDFIKRDAVAMNAFSNFTLMFENLIIQLFTTISGLTKFVSKIIIICTAQLGLNICNMTTVYSKIALPLVQLCIAPSGSDAGSKVAKKNKEIKRPN